MMRFLRGTNRLLAVPLLLLTVALAVIATLQYRWLDQVAEAERQQARRNLEFELERIEGEISAPLHAIFRAFLGPEDEDVRWLLEDWQPDARQRALVAAVYVADARDGAWRVQQLDLRTRDLADAPLPAVLEPLRDALDDLDDRGPAARFPGPLFSTVPAIFAVQLPSEDPDYFARRPQRVIFVQIDRRALGELLAASAKDLDVELLAGGTVLYRSMSRPADVTRTFRALAPRERPPRPPPGPPPGPRPPAPDAWQLGVAHRAGGLDAIVTRAHRRNLAVASLVLLLLVAASALLIALLRRGERLREQQSQFVASMSHELNTPLAILRVASENLHDGIVHDPEKVSRYVRTIARETAHLSEMVNHVLELAGMKAAAAVAERAPVDVGDVVQEAVSQSRWMTAGSDVALDVDVAPGLPRVLGDEHALTRAVQNLVANAIRHAGSGKWVGVQAARDDGFVRIVVEDRGPGIDSEDARHLFEPFYRGRNSRNVRGTGLGLTIVKQIVDEHGGSVTVERGRPAGAAFIVRLPAEGDS